MKKEWYFEKEERTGKLDLWRQNENQDKITGISEIIRIMFDCVFEEFYKEKDMKEHVKALMLLNRTDKQNNDTKERKLKVVNENIAFLSIDSWQVLANSCKSVDELFLVCSRKLLEGLERIRCIDNSVPAYLISEFLANSIAHVVDNTQHTEL